MTKKDEKKINLVKEIRKMIHDQLDEYVSPERIADYEKQKANGLKVEAPTSNRDAMKVCVARAREIGATSTGWKEPALLVYYNEKLLAVLEDLALGQKLMNAKLDQLVKVSKVKK